MKKTVLILMLGVVLNILSNAQNNVEINFINANRLFATAELGPNIKVFDGEVCFQQDSAYFYCDSAMYNSVSKNVDAFGNIVIQRLYNYDTIFIFADTLHYNGNTKIAQLREHVKMIQDTSVLTTNFFDYYLNEKYGKYYNGGKIISGSDTIYSTLGYYYSETKDVYFKDNVKIFNKKAKIYSDTIRHNLGDRISYLLGPSRIISDSTEIIAEKGYYDHDENQGYLSNHSIINSGEHSIEADSLYYDRKIGFGQAFKNVTITDTVQNLILKGDYGEFYEQGQKSLMTQNAVFMEIVDLDTLWMHSDTIYSYVDTLFDVIDTIPFRILFAYHHVKVFKNDLQLKCDSLIYTQLDSVFMMFGDPIIWSENQQLNGNYVELYMYKNDPKELLILDSTYVAEKIDTSSFNIVKAKKLHAWFKNRNVYKVAEMENIDAIYYLQNDSDSVTIGIGVLHCDTMNIFIDSNKIQLLVPYVKPTGTIYPPDKIPAEKKTISGFKWYDAIRPKKHDDIFIWP